MYHIQSLCAHSEELTLKLCTSLFKPHISLQLIHLSLNIKLLLTSAHTMGTIYFL